MKDDRIPVQLYPEEHRLLKSDADKENLAMHELLMLHRAKALSYDLLIKLLNEANKEWLKKNSPKIFKELEKIL